MFSFSHSFSIKTLTMGLCVAYINLGLSSYIGTVNVQLFQLQT